MNKRIKELLEQSGLQAYYDAQDGQIAKFAELLIKECATLTQPADAAIKRIAEQEHAPGNIITVYGSNPYDYCEQYSTNIDHWVKLAWTAVDTEQKILDHFELDD
jgi:hypothetical protein